jgi:hypothetical protein
MIVDKYGNYVRKFIWQLCLLFIVDGHLAIFDFDAGDRVTPQWHRLNIG